jgi:hypothetical protein
MTIINIAEKFLKYSIIKLYKIKLEVKIGIFKEILKIIICHPINTMIITNNKIKIIILLIIKVII